MDDFDAAFEEEAALEQAARRKASKAKGGKAAGGGKGKAKGKPKAKSCDSDEDEDEMSEDGFDEDSDSDFDEKPKKKAPATKKVAAPALASVEVARSAPKQVSSSLPKATISLAQAKMTTSAKPTKVATMIPEPPIIAIKPKEEEEENSGLSLAQRLLNRMKIANEGLSVAPVAVIPAIAPVQESNTTMPVNKGIKRAPKQAAKKESESDISYSPGTPADKPAKKATKGTAAHVMSIAVNDPDSPLAKPTKKVVAATKPAAVKGGASKKPAPKKKSSKYDSDEEEDDCASDASDDESVGAPLAPRALPARARKQIVYAVDSDEEEMDESFGDEDESEYESD